MKTITKKFKEQDITISMDVDGKEQHVLILRAEQDGNTFERPVLIGPEIDTADKLQSAVDQQAGTFAEQIGATVQGKKLLRDFLFEAPAQETPIVGNS